MKRIEIEMLVRKTLCVSLCVASSLNGPKEEVVLDLNSVLGMLQRTQQMMNQQMRNRHQLPEISDETDCDESSELLPEYTESVQTSREREFRQLSVQKHYPICHIERKIRRLNTNEYEYRPAYYEEVRCTSTGEGEKSNEICSSLGFSCIQWNKTIHLTRRRYTSDCWETRTMVIPAGCECMWPVHRLGDIALHV